MVCKILLNYFYKFPITQNLLFVVTEDLSIFWARRSMQHVVIKVNKQVVESKYAAF